MQRSIGCRDSVFSSSRQRQDCRRLSVIMIEIIRDAGNCQDCEKHSITTFSLRQLHFKLTLRSGVQVRVSWRRSPTPSPAGTEHRSHGIAQACRFRSLRLTSRTTEQATPLPHTCPATSKHEMFSLSSSSAPAQSRSIPSWFGRISILSLSIEGLTRRCAGPGPYLQLKRKRNV